jgi:hypothetical protein
MVRHGTAPFLECSSRGDKRFSAFYARVRGKCIEQWYQEAKQFEDGVDLDWKERQGLRPLNAGECHKLYAALWDEYIGEHPELLPVLRAASGLSDVFGKAGHACQATELWRIRNMPE